MLYVPSSSALTTAQALDDIPETTLRNVAFTRWQNFDPAALEPRCWVYGKHYLAGAVSATIADGGVGKSTLALTEAIAMVTGRPLLGITPNKEFFEDGACRDRRQVGYYNAEETLDEIKRRAAAICQHYEIDPKELDCGGSTNPWRPTANLTIISGHDFPLVIGTPGPNGEITFSENVEYLEDCDLEVIILDPFVSLHQCGENDNSAIDAVVKRLGRVAARCSKSVELVHHARKPAQGGHIEIGTADARGASALADGVRSLRMLNRMTASEALLAKLDDHRGYFRLDNGKSNYAATTDDSQWFRHVPVLLPNGDDVGVIVPWHMPGAFDGVTPAHMNSVRDLARGGQYRADPRSTEWIGDAVCDVLDLDAESEGDRKRVKIILKEWYRKGVLKKVENRDPETRKVFIYVEAGEWSEP